MRKRDELSETIAELAEMPPRAARDWEPGEDPEVWYIACAVLRPGETAPVEIMVSHGDVFWQFYRRVTDEERQRFAFPWN